jgi:hypothetical protein
MLYRPGRGLLAGPVRGFGYERDVASYGTTIVPTKAHCGVDVGPPSDQSLSRKARVEAWNRVRPVKGMKDADTVPFRSIDPHT